MIKKIITEEDFWVCTDGAIPTQFQGNRELLHDPNQINYITKEDKATVGWLDFGCKKQMLLAAIIAAAAVVVAVAIGVATVATGGVALVAMCAIAGLVGGAIGGVIGGLLCGQKVAECREWHNYKENMIIQGSYAITEDSFMTCKAGGVIRYAPNIHNWLEAILYAGISYDMELIKCAGMGAMIGLGGAMLGVGAASVPGTGGALGTGFNFAGRAVTLLKPTIGSVAKNLVLSVPYRLLSFGESAQYTYATGGINRQGERAGIGKEFVDTTLPEREFAKRMHEKGLAGLKPSDALFLLYFLNVKFDPPGTYRDSAGELRYARGNAAGKHPGTYVDKSLDPRSKPPKPANGKPYEGDVSKPRKPSDTNPNIDHSKTTINKDGSTTYYDYEGNSLTYNKEGYPVFKSSEILSEKKVYGMNGDYTHDSAMANELAGYSSTPEGYVWHHVEDGITMQLVPKYHNHFPHTGGASGLKNGSLP